MEIEEANKFIGDLERRFIKDKFRFSFGKDGERHSGAWVAWGRKNDYYIGARSILGSVKISLHASGICRLALTDRQFSLIAEQGIPQPEDRAFVKWRRPPAPQSGAALAVIIVFPTNYMTLSAPASSAQKPLLIFEPAPAGMAWEVGFFYSREPVSSLEPKFLEIGKPLFQTDLDNGEAVWIVAREAPFDPTIIPSIDKFKVTTVRAIDNDFLIGTEKKT